MSDKRCRWMTISKEIIIPLMVPIVISICGFFIQSAMKQKEVNARLVELSINILSKNPSEKQVPIRTWAVDLINKNSNVKINDRLKSLLIYNGYFITEMKDDTEMTDDAIMGGVGDPHFIDKTKKSPPNKP